MEPQLSDDQLEEVRVFFDSDAAAALFTLLEGGCLADWIAATDTDQREECWRRFQTITQLKVSLRDATAMKRLTERAQGARVYRT